MRVNAGGRSRGRICASIGEKTMARALTAAKKAAVEADVVEIRLDLMDTPRVSPFCEALAAELLFTCRARWEGGGFAGTEEERLDLLEEATRQNAAYVDLELRAPERSWQRLRRARQGRATRLICSWHDFESTPSESELMELLAAMAEKEADVGKIVATAADHLDVLRLLGLQQYASRMELPLIAFAMGGAGRISRIASPYLGGYMTYCAAADGGATAPGQIDVARMAELYRKIDAGD